MQLAALSRSHISMRMNVISTLVMGLGSTFAATAQESESHEGSGWSLGIAAISSQKPFTDIDRDNKVIPLIFYEGKYVELVGLASSSIWRISTLANLSNSVSKLLPSTVLVATMRMKPMKRPY